MGGIDRHIGNLKLTALVIVKNEAHQIAELLDTIAFADEVIIVDSYSDDGTPEIIQNHPGVILVQRTFDNFSSQRNFALGLASNHWVLFIDADERIPEKLKRELHSLDIANTDVVAFKIRRQMYVEGKKIRFSGFQRDKVFRLFNKKFVHFDEKTFVHEQLIVRGKTAELNEKLDHYSFQNNLSYQLKLDHYAKLRAEELFINELSPNAFHFLIKPMYRFLNHYIMRFGFLDGSNGFLLAKLHAEGVRKRYFYLNKLRNKE